MVAEGWYQDPYQLHLQRWFSNGEPTSLVRDGSGESEDPPPGEAFTGPLVPATVEEPADGNDLIRADDPTRPYSAGRAADAAIDAAAQSGIGFE